MVRAQVNTKHTDYLIHTDYYGVEQGLSHRNVEAIQQDNKGFIWFGTNYGLDRFDGYNFKWFTKEKNGLQSNMINHMIKDSDGLFWLFRTGHRFDKNPISIDIFDPVSEEVMSYENKFGKSTPMGVKDISDFIASKNGLIAFITKKNQLVFYTPQKNFNVVELKIHPITLACFSNHNTLYAYSSNNNNFSRNVILEIDFNGTIIHTYEHKNITEYFFIAGIDQNDKLYYIAKSSMIHEPEQFDKGILYTINSAGEEEELFKGNTSLLKEKINLDIQTNANEYNFWMNQNESNFCLFGRNSFQVFNLQQNWNFELSKNSTWPSDPNIVFFDNNNKAWVGTSFGVHLIQMSPNPFQKILYNSPNTPTTIRGIVEDDQKNLWIGSDRGTCGFWIQLKDEPDAKDFKVQLKKLSNGKSQVPPFVGYLYGLLNDHLDQKWIGCGETNSIFRIGSKDDGYNSTSYFISDSLKPFNTNIWSFYEDESGRIWFGTDKSRIGYIDQQTNKVILLNELTGVNEAGGCIYQFLKDRTGLTWLATDNGLFNLNVKTNQIEKYHFDENQNKVIIPWQCVFHIHEDKDGSFWLATRGEGLIHWIPGNSNYRKFNKADGLSDNTIYAVYEDDFNNLWMPSDYGIIKFNKKTYQATAYLEKDGITNNEFNRIAHYKNKEGTIYFGGLNGITSFNPKDFHQDSSKSDAPLVITAFQQFVGDENKLVDKKNELLLTNTIVLNPMDRYILLEFSLLNYEPEKRNQYAYKIDGVDADWNYQNENSIRFSRLQYGNYKLHIKGQSSNGQWSKNQITLNVSVIKPFYLKNWFIIISVFFFILGIILFYYIRTDQLRRRTIYLEDSVNKRTETIRLQNNQLEKQAIDLLELDSMKSRFFANVSHELRTPLTLILGPIQSVLKSGELSERNYHFLDRAQKSGKDLLKLVKSILHLSTMDAGKMEYKENSEKLFPFLSQFIAPFESHAESLGIDLSFEYLGEQNLQVLIDCEKVKTILENFLMNALKFTGVNGKIKIRVEDHVHSIKFSVSDTGRGIHPNDLPFIFDRFYQSKEPLSGKQEAPIEGGLGIGLALCKEFATIIHGNIWAESELNEGSTFYLEISRKEVVDSSIEDFINVDEMDSVNHTNEFESNLLNKPIENKNKTILIVEDNHDLRKYLVTILSPYYQIIEAENGQIALSILNQNPEKFPKVNYLSTNNYQQTSSNCQLPTDNCQLILSDIMMPLMDGFQLLEALKSDDALRQIPFIILTARVNMQDKLKALRIGVDDYLIKPFDEEELLARISNLLINAKERNDFIKIEQVEKPAQVSLKISTIHKDLNWLENLENLIRKEVKNDLLSVSWIAQQMFLSERQLNRRIKGLTGLGPVQYIREIRLQEGRRMLEESIVKTVKDAANAVSFKDEKYFAQLFRERFGKNPSELL